VARLHCPPPDDSSAGGGVCRHWGALHVSCSTALRGVHGDFLPLAALLATGCPACRCLALVCPACC
jgi:hypothetical protein